MDSRTHCCISFHKTHAKRRNKNHFLYFKISVFFFIERLVRIQSVQPEVKSYAAQPNCPTRASESQSRPCCACLHTKLVSRETLPINLREMHRRKNSRFCFPAFLSLSPTSGFSHVRIDIFVVCNFRANRREIRSPLPPPSLPPILHVGAPFQKLNGPASTGGLHLINYQRAGERLGVVFGILNYETAVTLQLARFFLRALFDVYIPIAKTMCVL